MIRTNQRNFIQNLKQTEIKDISGDVKFNDDSSDDSKRASPHLIKDDEKRIVSKNTGRGNSKLLDEVQSKQNTSILTKSKNASIADVGKVNSNFFAEEI